VLSEEAFVLVLGLVATGLLILGILEAFLPTRRPPPWPDDEAGRLTAEAVRRLRAGREEEA
jgi:hypothetical protein